MPLPLIDQLDTMLDRLDRSFHPVRVKECHEVLVALIRLLRERIMVDGSLDLD